MMYTFLRNLTVTLMLIALGEAAALAHTAMPGAGQTLGAAAADAVTTLAGLL